MESFSPYKSIFIVGFEHPCFYKDSTGRILLIEDEMSEVFTVQNNQLKSLGFEWEDKFKCERFEVATRKEIQAAGLWDMVVNKDNYSSKEDEIETKLDEYQKIGEQVVKEMKKS